MSILMQKLLARRFRNEEIDDVGGASGGDADALQREQELEASRQGWVPKHKFKGPEDQWKDASTFLRVGRETKSGLQSEINRLKTQLSEFQGTAKQFAEFQQKQIEQRDAEIASLIKDLKRQEREAIREGNDEHADAISDRIELLTEERGNLKKAPSDEGGKPQYGPGSGNTDPSKGAIDPKHGIDENGYTENPALLNWISDGNQWMRDSRPMREYAFATANELIQAGETARGPAFLKILREKMEEAFPRYFNEGRSNPTDRGSVAGSGSHNRASSGRSKSDLPPEDLAMMELGIRQGWTTEEKFLKNYFSEGPRIHKTAAKK
jgi:hypothetical protein